MVIPAPSIQDLADSSRERPNWIWMFLRIGRLLDRIKDYVRPLGPYVHRSPVTSIDLHRIASLPASEHQAKFDDLVKKRTLPCDRGEAALRD